MKMIEYHSGLGASESDAAGRRELKWMAEVAKNESELDLMVEDYTKKEKPIEYILGQLKAHSSLLRLIRLIY